MQSTLIWIVIEYSAVLWYVIPPLKKFSFQSVLKSGMHDILFLHLIYIKDILSI